MPELIAPPMTNTVKFTPPPAHLLPSLTKAAEQAALLTLKPGENGKYVLVGTKNPGEAAKFNAAIVWRAGDHVEVRGWVAKTWGAEFSGGVAIGGTF